GNVSGINQPVGPVGLVGLGSNRGVFGSSGNGSGVYGSSDGNYGIWGQSETYRGMTGRTDRVDNNYGFYTPDNMYSLNINLAGAVMQVMQNGGTQPLSAGDVVVFSGINRLETAVDAPMVQVSQTTVANSTAVAGVVYSRFNIEAIDPNFEMPDDSQANRQAQMEVTPAGSAAPGDYVLVVVQGPAQVKVSELAVNQVQPGDLLTTSAEAGLADKATMVEMDGRPTAAPGTVFAKALEPVDGQQEMIYVYVTLQ
ncbi:MAG: hypothetical protein KDE51_06495, partial [Anaerolineales bacterium]|nr:hypothetical protein [Anaerolineales bacterium]